MCPSLSPCWARSARPCEGAGTWSSRTLPFGNNSLCCTTEAAAVRTVRPSLLGSAFPPLVALARRSTGGAARNRHPRASPGLSRLVDMEVAASRARTPADRLGAESLDPGDGARQPALGCTPDPR
jgi:hypothetical protein